MLAGGLPLGPVKAAGIAGGIAALVAGLSVGPTRKLLDRVLPDPGEGPSEKAREKGFFKIDVHARRAAAATSSAGSRPPATPATRRPA